MSNVDRSASATVRKMREKAIVTFHRLNPNVNEGGANILSSGVLTERKGAEMAAVCCAPVTITNFVCTPYLDVPIDSPYYSEYGLLLNLSWDPLPGASYVLTSNFTTDLILINSASSASVYVKSDSNNGYERVFTLTATTTCGKATAVTTGAPCFLAGSLVQMASGKEIPIEDVVVGDQVLGAFGEINTVLALHRPLLGNNLMCRINDEHSTTNHHPHVSVDRKFYCGNPYLVSSSTYGRLTKVINASGAQEMLMLHGLKKERIKKIGLGIDLKTVEGSRKIRTLATFSMPEDTQLYNLVISGSHTYHVEGYAVTGWPREDDFNYDNWAPK